MMNKLQAIVMAAGKSSRFKTGRTKLLEKICGQQMLLYTTKMLEKLNFKLTVVVGYRKEEIQKILKQQHGAAINFVEQAQQRGTAHALLCSQNSWESENLLIMNADMPLVSADLIHQLVNLHLQKKAAVSFVTAHNLDPSLNSYGRVISKNGIIKIIEAKDYAQLIKQDPTQEVEDCCINAGIYLFKKSFLESALQKVQSSSVSGEFYITDLIQIASEAGESVEMLEAAVDQIRGINTLRELWIAEQLKQAEIINHWMNEGVRFQGAQNSYIELDVKIGAGTIIGQGVQLIGSTEIGENCNLEPFCIIKDSVIGAASQIGAFSFIENRNLPNNAITKPQTVLQELVQSSASSKLIQV